MSTIRRMVSVASSSVLNAGNRVRESKFRQTCMTDQRMIGSGGSRPIHERLTVTTTSEKLLTGGRPIALDVYVPVVKGKPPAVVILHGSFGLLPEYRADIVSFAEALVGVGIAAVMPHFLESTGTEPGMGVLALIKDKRPIWRQACSDAVSMVANDARFDAARLGVLGFSLGGNLALSLAMDPPKPTKLRCVVDFFGPTRTLEPHWSNMPPVLIFHGAKDPLVDPSESAFLVAQLESAGRKRGTGFTYEAVPGEGHGFHGAALKKSRDEMIAFITRVL